MKHLIFAVLSPLITAGLASCATSQSAEQSCAAETKAKLAQTYTKTMERDARNNIRKLSILGKSPAMTTGISPKLQSRAVFILRNIDQDLKIGRGFMRLKQLSETCQDPQLVETSLSTLLQSESSSPNLDAFVKATDIYRYWLESSSEELKQGAVELDVPLPRMEDF